MAYHPQKVPCLRRLEVCKSMPYPLQGSGVNWGHDFGGLVLLDNEDHYPWEDRVFEREGDSEHSISVRVNPKDIPEIEQLLGKPSQIPAFVKLGSTGQVRQRADIFGRLPLEICDMIACLLPTSDVFNLRQVSKVFIPIFSNQQFWASRFKPHADRCWLFELWKVPEPQDWRWLYRRTCDTRISPALRNRKRVWKLIQSLKNIISLCRKDNFEEPVSQDNVLSRRYRGITGDVRQEKSTGSHHDFNEGCRLFNRQYVSICQFISQTSFSTVQVGGTEYVSGIRFVSPEGTAIELGYWSEKKGCSVNIASLRGFNVAVGSRVIQAIQVITDKRHTSQWFGSPTESPITQYLAVYEHIRAVKAGFDVSGKYSLLIPFPSINIHYSDRLGMQNGQPCR
ncbi:hypothetical protein BGW36DRAFT_364084 [Talaromyces proteolyticus]|uniref:F-box domain-containing protein n=1 Tax=Talaromyces proteolyticus TaxID=1131652 RepID=A0AAD4KKD1_9EURO|nr:uncharacterized protein BGW36DRAFT_364084 [Talaromyces proteolyticus]KAH8690508.1 hypothetical protein BGW36DRAFT_364084 [Talaromyces proteolyticus]